MPDWFYRTVAKPILFSLPERTARKLALGLVGTLGRFWSGRAVIDFLGHMRPDPRLAVRVAGCYFPSPVGIGWRVDPERRGSQALARFGAGCIEILEPRGRDVFLAKAECVKDGPFGESPAHGPSVTDVPCVRRRVTQLGAEELVFPSGISLAVLAADVEPPAALHEGGRGVLLQVGTRATDGGWQVPAALPLGLPERVRAWRAWLEKDAALIVAGGVAQPADALALIEAGADLILVDAGMIFRGPGLVKRCNEAILTRRMQNAERGVATDETEIEASTARRAWFWAAALGVSLLTGGVLTLALAGTRVLLPYDEHYLGVTAETLMRNEPRLFAFMAHDRATLAGTMIGLGWLYVVLAWHGVRREVHGTRTAVVASALTGFASFFSFLGFGYFDTLHAFVAAILFQLTVQVMVGAPGGAGREIVLVDDEDVAWRRAQWGQLLWVMHAVGLIIAGGVILGIGVTQVFVAEDLAFLCLTVEQAQALGDRMIAVVSHDRATLGGMLLSAGMAMLLPVLWNYRRGAAWLWQAIAGLGGAAYTAALGVHLRVGYNDPRHLVPAFAGLALWAGGLGLSRRYLRAQP